VKHSIKTEVQFEILDNDKVSKVEVPQPDFTVNYSIKSLDGTERETGQHEFKSFVGNFAKIINYLLNGVTNTDTIVGTSGGTAIDVNIFKLKLDSAATITTHGLLVGTLVSDSTWDDGTSAIPAIGKVDTANYNLSALIPNDGDGEYATYGATEVTISGDSLIVKRRITNNQSTGGATMKIGEVGLVSTDGTNYYLIARDVFKDSIISVAPGELIDIWYEFPIVVGGGFVKNFLRWLSSLFVGDDSVETIFDVNGSGTLTDFSTALASQSLLAPEEDSNYGIVLSGATSIADITERANFNPLEDYDVPQPIVHADDALSYGATTATTYSFLNNTHKIGVYRDFTNNDSDNDIYVKEVALYSFDDTTDKYFMFTSTPATVDSQSYIQIPKGKVLRVSYTLSFPLV
jgi:hypothetical protein